MKRNFYIIETRHTRHALANILRLDELSFKDSSRLVQREKILDTLKEYLYTVVLPG